MAVISYITKVYSRAVYIPYTAIQHCLPTAFNTLHCYSIYLPRAVGRFALPFYLLCGFDKLSIK